MQPLTPPSFRKDHFLVNTSGGASSGSGGLFKSQSAVSVGRDFSGSVTPIQHQRKISYQNSHLFRSSGSGSASRTEISNLIRVRNSQLGKSAPSLSPSSVRNTVLFLFCFIFLNCPHLWYDENLWHFTIVCINIQLESLIATSLHWFELRIFHLRCPIKYTENKK